MWCLIIACALLSSGAIAETCRPSTSPSKGAVIASWYGADHHGRRTASGEPFDEHQLTAAHPSLPLRTFVRVTNLVNGRTVQVKIMDRGPGYGRGIDLSEGAAERLGMRQCGLAPVLLMVDARQTGGK
jgi:rare lipoprotein A